MTYTDPRLSDLRKRFHKASNKTHAAFHKNYHKSTKDFYGLRNAALVEAFQQVFPKKEKIEKKDAVSLGLQLWGSNWFEEQAAGLMLLARIADELTNKDLPMLKKIANECEGWGMLDYLATKHLGTLALNYGEAVYPIVRRWATSKHLWTRRASILIHILPARKKQLRAEYALPTFVDLLHEKEFFIRKAIGWTLREIAKQYPEMTYEFLKDHQKDVSGLTMREGARRLPEKMRKELLGK